MNPSDKDPKAGALGKINLIYCTLVQKYFTSLKYFILRNNRKIMARQIFYKKQMGFRDVLNFIKKIRMY